jgi:hypothetical protein
MAQRWVALLQGGFNTAEASLTVAVPEVTEGTLLQLHVRDSHWSQKGVKTCLQVCMLLLAACTFPVGGSLETLLGTQRCAWHALRHGLSFVVCEYQDTYHPCNACRSMQVTCLAAWRGTPRSWGLGCTPAEVPRMMRRLPSVALCLTWLYR